jgi:hypothetical protein
MYAFFFLVDTELKRFRKHDRHSRVHEVLQCVTVSCSVLQCLAVSCSCSVLQCVASGHELTPSWARGVAVCCSVLQCLAVAVCSSVLQCVAV